MNGKSPADRAAELVSGTKLADVAVRRKLAAGGRDAIEKSDDAMIKLAQLVDQPSRAVRKPTTSKSRSRYDKPTAKSPGAVQSRGENNFPDATFTLRLAFGQVRGYSDQGRTLAPGRL